jgi:thioredoxin-like negative regulator of GroEL
MSCGASFLAGALSLYSLGRISIIGKEIKKEHREQAMLNEMIALRQQVATQAMPQQAVNEDDTQIKLASKFWKQGNREVAIEILEAMPHNARAQEILTKIRGRQ